MAFLAQQQLATDPTFLLKVRHAMVKAAIAIQNESTGTPNHTQRAAYALKVLAAPDDYDELFSMGVVTDESISSSSTDATLENRVNALWNAYAFAAP